MNIIMAVNACTEVLGHPGQYVFIQGIGLAHCHTSSCAGARSTSRSKSVALGSLLHAVMLREVRHRMRSALYNVLRIYVAYYT